MGEIIYLPIREITPEHRAKLVDKLAFNSLELSELWDRIEKLQREQEDIRRTLGHLNEKGV